MNSHVHLCLTVNCNNVELTATGNKNQRNRNDDDKKKVQSEQEIVNEIENKDVTEAEHSDDEFKEKCKVKEACVL